jgi:hypothetical protein
MYVTQSGKGNLQVGMRPIVDQERLEREYQQIAAQRAALLHQPQPQPTQQAPQQQSATSASQQEPIQVEPAQAAIIQSIPHHSFQPAMMAPVSG